MIVRTWHGCVPIEKGDAFALHLQRSGLDDAKNTTGNRGFFLKRLPHGIYEHFFLATYWENLDAVKAFAGEDYHMAVHYPGDDAFDIIPDPYVFHHTVEGIEPHWP